MVQAGALPANCITAWPGQLGRQWLVQLYGGLAMLLPARKLRAPLQASAEAGAEGARLNSCRHASCRSPHPPRGTVTYD